jgi:hypothetical protein
VIEGCYAAQLSDAALACLVKGGVIAHEQRGDAAAILRSISKWLERAGPLDSQIMKAGHPGQSAGRGS